MKKKKMYDENLDFRSNLSISQSSTTSNFKLKDKGVFLLFSLYFLVCARNTSHTGKGYRFYNPC